MAKKYNEDYDIRVAPEFSGQDSNLRTTSKSQKYFLIFLVVVGIYSGFQTATQYFASELQYSPYLGNAMFHIADIPIYFPLKILTSWGDIRRAYPNLSEETISMGYCGGAPFLIIALLITCFTSNKISGNRFLHGSAL